MKYYSDHWNSGFQPVCASENWLRVEWRRRSFQTPVIVFTSTKDIEKNTPDSGQFYFNLFYGVHDLT